MNTTRTTSLMARITLGIVTLATLVGSALSAEPTRVAIRPEVLEGWNSPQPTAPTTAPYDDYSRPLPSLRNYGRELFGNDYRVSPQAPSQPAPWTPTPQPSPWTPQPVPTTPSRPTTNETDLSSEITARYQNAEMISFVSRASDSQVASLFAEITQLVDSRHVKPVSYEVRTRRALQTLAEAVGNPAFLRAAGVNPDPRQVQVLQQELLQLAATNQARTSSEAVGLMQWASELANQRIGIRRSAVAVEFVNGSLDALDEYTALVPSSSGMSPTGAIDGLETASLEENIVGVGVELKAHERGALVMGTVDGGPAARARLMRGDLIIGIDGRSVSGQSLSQIASQISGPAGSVVTFRIDRNGQELTSSMRRERVYVSSVAGARMIDSNVGYVRLKQFSESSAEDLEKAMWSLYQNGMTALVLDLRGNPGGLLSEAIEVSNLFVPCGRIVATRGRTSSDNTDESATYEKTWRIPLVVLVDGDSASASEIFAAAIQENERGVIVGRTTYGKGTVQTHFPLRSVAGTLKLTTAMFYSPRGREMAGQGVRPDVPVAYNSVDFATDVENDADVRAARGTIRQGLPAQMAANSATCKPKYELSNLGF